MSRMYCQAEALCPARPRHTAMVLFATWKDEHGNYGRIKAIPVCDAHKHPYDKTMMGALLPGQTAVTLVSFTHDTFTPDTL